MTDLYLGGPPPGYTQGVAGINDGGTAMIAKREGVLMTLATPTTAIEDRVGRNADGSLLSGVDVVDPVTGGSKGMKPERYGLLPVEALAEVARVYGYGSEKYDDRNWEKSYAWSLSYDALQRHINAFWGGEINDPESGLAHLAHAAFHILTLLTFAQKEIGTDDRSNL